MKRIVLIFTLLFLFSQANAKELITVKDMLGRQVSIPKKVERIVALNATLRYVVYLQAFDKVVGVEDVKKRNLMKGNVAVGKH